MTSTFLEKISFARTDGNEAGIKYVEEFGIDDAFRYARQLSSESRSTPEMFGYIDGFCNAVIDRLPTLRTG